MSSFTVSGDIQVDGFGIPLFKRLSKGNLPRFATGARKIAAYSQLASRLIRPVSAGRTFAGDSMDRIYGRDYLGSTLFQKFLSKTVVGKAFTKAVGKIPVVGKVAQTALTTYRDVYTQASQPGVSMPSASPVTVAEINQGMQPKKSFPIVPVAIGAGVLVIAAVLILKK